MSAPGADWGEQLRRLVEGFRPADGDGPSGGHCDNTWCPLCQAAAVLRGERPDVTAALADLLATASAALRQFAEQAPAGGTGDAEPGVKEPGGTGPEDANAGDGDPGSGPSGPAVQRIDLA